MSSEATFRFMEVEVGAIESNPDRWDQFNPGELTAVGAVIKGRFVELGGPSDLAFKL